MLDALWQLMSRTNVDMADMLIFLPSNRAVRSVEKMIVAHVGHAVVLPTLVALGMGVDDIDEYTTNQSDIITNNARIIATAKLLTRDAMIGSYANALPIARDLIRMSDYLENEGIDVATIDWNSLVDDKYAAHFQHKAELLNIISRIAGDIYPSGKFTMAAARNRDIRAWIRYIASDTFDKQWVCVCGSTGSVPATADLMVEIANNPRGAILLSGTIAGRESDFALNTNPYNSEYKFLQRINCDVGNVRIIDVGPSPQMEFMNFAFGNDTHRIDMGNALNNVKIVECERESEEAAVVAEIAARAVHDNKSVLVITPDAAGNQRIAAAVAARGIMADFSGGHAATMSNIGRAILNMLDEQIESGGNFFDTVYAQSDYDLLRTIINIYDRKLCPLTPNFEIDDASRPIWMALAELSDLLNVYGIRLSVYDARAFVADVLSSVSIRNRINDDASVVVLGTIESRMQTADVVILTGLNDGMFPARGYENAWLPRDVAKKIGLPPSDRKISLMSLDFMNLSCGGCVYWTRSRVSGGTMTTESRFISRVVARGQNVAHDNDVLASVRGYDDVMPVPLSYAPPCPPADWSDVYVTELELLIHNPYAFYVRHILRLNPRKDYWQGPDARDFGTLVHDVIEHARPDATPDELVAAMDYAARGQLKDNSVLFRFWHKRFLEIAPVAANAIAKMKNARAEIDGVVNIAARNIRARADRVWDDGVMDIKTGAIPTKKQLTDGNMPQLPLEAYMLQSGGFAEFGALKNKTPVIEFLQLRNGDCESISYTGEIAAQMIRAAVDKTTSLVNMYSVGGASYEYHETSDAKYRAYDDFARIDD